MRYAEVEKQMNKKTTATIIFLIIFGALMLLGALCNDVVLFLIMLVGFIFVVIVGLHNPKYIIDPEPINELKK